LKFFKKQSKTRLNVQKINVQKINVQKINVKQLEKGLFDLLLRFVFKNGLKNSNKISLLNSFNYFFSLFSNRLVSWEGLDSKISILKQSFFKDMNFFNINSILNWLINFINPIFDINCFEVPKKYKKKIKKKLFFQVKV